MRFILLEDAGRTEQGEIISVLPRLYPPTPDDSSTMNNEHEQARAASQAEITAMIQTLVSVFTDFDVTKAYGLCAPPRPNGDRDRYPYSVYAQRLTLWLLEKERRMVERAWDFGNMPTD